MTLQHRFNRLRNYVARDKVMSWILIWWLQLLTWGCIRREQWAYAVLFAAITGFIAGLQFQYFYAWRSTRWYQLGIMLELRRNHSMKLYMKRQDKMLDEQFEQTGRLLAELRERAELLHQTKLELIREKYREIDYDSERTD